MLYSMMYTYIQSLGRASPRIWWEDSLKSLPEQPLGPLGTSCEPSWHPSGPILTASWPSSEKITGNHSIEQPGTCLGFSWSYLDPC